MSKRPIMDRIWDWTIPIPECGCHVWLGSITSDGYGRIQVDGALRRVHRVAYEQLVGPIPEGLTLDHLCRVRACWRPDHLEPVTNRENTLRGINQVSINARKTHCNQGHPLSGDNLILTTDGRRRCRECHHLWRCSAEQQAYDREYRRKRLASRRPGQLAPPVHIETAD